MQYVSHPLIYRNTVEDREYQRRIVETAKGRNILAVLPTALGKTIISALIAVDILYNYRDSRVLIMAPTKPLCVQHKDTFMRIIKLPDEDFVLLTGKIPSDYREAVWNGRARLVFATPQVVKNDILLKGLKLKDFGLVIFDECHRAVKVYSYTEVARQYVEHSDYPLIIGMTASPGSDLERIRMVCESLFIEHIEYRSDDDHDVKPYIHPVHVEWRQVDLPLQYKPLRETLKGILDFKIRWLQNKGYLKNVHWNVSRKELIEVGKELRYNIELSMEEERGPLYRAIMQQSAALTLFHMLELLETQGIYTLGAFLERMTKEGNEKKSHVMLIREEGHGRILSLIGGNSNVEHPKMGLLMEVVKDQFTKSPNSRIIVFTQYRDTATHLVEELNKVAGVRAERFVGQASRLGDKGLTQEAQGLLINDFRKGYLNVLAATSIAEEGLDIPEVDLVIFYEPIPSEIRYIQRRGRTGRKTPGRVVILATRDTNDMLYLYSSSRRVEMMKRIAAKLSSSLKPVLRLRPKPPSNPIPHEELMKLYGKLGEKREVPLVSEAEKFRSLEREISRAEKSLYFKILERGLESLSDDALYHEMEAEGFSRNAARAALGKLVRARHVVTMSGRSSIPTKSIPGSKTMNIEIERVMAGQAVVLVDGRWRARLLPENYDGPRELIRKGSRFQALSELYDGSGVLCVKVRQVVKAFT